MCLFCDELGEVLLGRGLSRSLGSTVYRLSPGSEMWRDGDFASATGGGLFLDLESFLSFFVQKGMVVVV